MNNQQQFAQLVEEVDFRLAHRRYLRERGVHLIVTHSRHIPGTLCAPGEMIEDITIGGQTPPRSLGLSHMSLLLVDCLCRYRLPLTGRRIEQIMNSDPFYAHYASNRTGRNQSIARPDRKSVRVYVPRIWKQMEKVCRDIGLNINPKEVLLCKATESNIVVYQLKVTVEIVHVDVR